MTRRAVIICALLTGVFVVWSRAALAPRYLSTFDSINFALAIERFDPRLDQPQPPGYPLFVGLLKILNLLTHDARNALMLAGLAGSLAAAALVWRWAASMFGEPAGALAALLLAVHPVFWCAGVLNPVRTFLALLAAATAMAAWRRRFYTASLCLGLLSGFRPEALLLLLPVWALAGWRREGAFATWLTGAGLLCAGALAWLIPLAVSTGGPAAMSRGFFDYLRANSRDYSAAFGAPAASAAATAAKVLVWNFSGAVAWAWVLPFVWRAWMRQWTREKALLLAFAFAPPFLFHALIHGRDADQTLISIPVVCVLGAVALASVRRRALIIGAALVAAAISYRTFRRPLFPQMQAASKGYIRWVGDWTEGTVQALATLRAGSTPTLVWDDAPMNWRQASYYFPHYRLLAIVHRAGAADEVDWIAGPSHVPAQAAADGSVLLPDGGPVVLGVAPERLEAMAKLPGAVRRGPLIVLARPSGPIDLGDGHSVTAEPGGHEPEGRPEWPPQGVADHSECGLKSTPARSSEPPFCCNELRTIPSVD